MKHSGRYICRHSFYLAERRHDSVHAKCDYRVGSSGNWRRCGHIRHRFGDPLGVLRIPLFDPECDWILAVGCHYIRKRQAGIDRIISRTSDHRYQSYPHTSGIVRARNGRRDRLGHPQFMDIRTRLRKRQVVLLSDSLCREVEHRFAFSSAARSYLPVPHSGKMARRNVFIGPGDRVLPLCLEL